MAVIKGYKKQSPLSSPELIFQQNLPIARTQKEKSEIYNLIFNNGFDRVEIIENLFTMQDIDKRGKK